MTFRLHPSMTGESQVGKKSSSLQQLLNNLRVESLTGQMTMSKPSERRSFQDFRWSNNTTLQRYCDVNESNGSDRVCWVRQTACQSPTTQRAWQVNEFAKDSSESKSLTSQIVQRVRQSTDQSPNDSKSPTTQRVWHVREFAKDTNKSKSLLSQRICHRVKGSDTSLTTSSTASPAISQRVCARICEFGRTSLSHSGKRDHDSAVSAMTSEIKE